MPDNRTNNNHSLSKSLYVKGLQCHKSLWLHKNKPELKDKVSVTQQATFSTGTDVGILAQQLFPGGVLVPFEELSYEDQISMTEEAIASGKRTIYEATFRFDGIFMKADILHRGKRGWELYEVKSSTGVKDVYMDDLAIQYYVITGSGLKLNRSSLVHINNKYVRNGEIDVNELFAVADLTTDIMSMQKDVAANLKAMKKMLAGKMPDIDIGPHCSDPYECAFSGHCWQHIPKHSVFDFADIGKPDPFPLYQQGIILMKDVSREELGWRQKLQLDAMKMKKVIVEEEKVKTFLDDLWYPLCFLDFETTYMTPVPLFEGTSPNKQVPFQYSLHVVDKQGKKPRHFEFLAEPGKDPRKDFLNSLLENLPADGCIVAWNQNFEISRLKELGAQFPRKQKKIAALIEHFRDLMTPFKKKDIYHRDFDGSYSIKAVLPALIPDLSYKGMPVSNGEEASIAWLSLWGETDKRKVQETRQQLLDYCCLDTLAMVKILEVMRNLTTTRA
ncbi:hypothetical protein OR1_01621 [Geobacter sp. OR-1]|uniref:DUF2779 domain-containing protein n=1 Tax=Geobacter sp. OR-1 TaxID=1266765 RepID=UPI0005436797|nr:DUF2779 domain-containing protein [Geobacter sp. OR-1]GAM09346.1 hypothetical protein OR1_01621 [Geobacter sp. OR-1]